MSDYGDNIRRISRYEYLLKQIRQLESQVNQEKKLPIDSDKSIAYLDKKTLGTVVQAATTGATKPNQRINTQTSSNGDDQTNNTNDALEGAKEGASQALDSFNPLNGVANASTTSALTSLDNTSRDGWYTADSILDAAVDAAGKAPPIPGQAINNNEFTGDVINAVNGLTDGSLDYTIFFRDALNAYVAPSGWDNPWEGPIDSTYTAGRVWALISGGTKYFSNYLGGLVAIREGLDGSRCYTVSGGLITSTTFTNTGTLQFSGNHGGVVGGSSGALGGTVYAYKAYDGLAVGIGKYGQELCGTSPGDTTACSANAPLTTNWDTDMGLIQLAWVTPATVIAGFFAAEYIGRFMPHPLDNGSSVPSIYQDGASVLDLQTTGGKDIRIGPMRDGGWYMYERNVITGLPAAAATVNAIAVVNPNRTLRGYLTTNEWQKLLPI